MGIAFQEIDLEIFNVALLVFDAQNDIWSDELQTNNGDLVKIMETVINTINYFLTQNITSTIYIEANSQIKNLLYNRILKTYIVQLQSKFEIECIRKDGIIESYDHESLYFSFYIYNKK